MSSEKKLTVDVQSLIIFNPKLSKHEGEDEKKILYSYPLKLSDDEKIQTVSLCEAMSNFTKEFTSSPCQFIHTLKSRITIYNLEDDFWIVLTVKVPESNDVYYDEEVQNDICECMLRHCREMFFLFNGPPSAMIDSIGIDRFKEKLAKFFNPYITSGMLDGYYITDILTGIQMLPIEKDVFKQVTACLQRLEYEFTAVYKSVLLFNNSFVYSTVSKEDLGILYRYLIVTLLPKCYMNEGVKSSFTPKNLGRFITKNSELSTVFLRNTGAAKSKGSLTECLVIAYKALQATVVMFVELGTTIDDRFYSGIHDSLGPQLTSLAQLIIGRNGKSTADNYYKYLYWNPETLSLKSTLFPAKQIKADLPPVIPMEMMQLMTDMKNESETTEHLDSSVKEFGVKLNSDSWVVCLIQNKRKLFLAINKRNFSLVDVSKEMKSVCNRDFHDIFQFDDE